MEYTTGPCRSWTAANRLLEIESGGVVFAVGDDQQGLLGTLGIFRELIGGGDDCVIESGAALRIDVGQALRAACRCRR